MSKSTEQEYIDGMVDMATTYGGYTDEEAADLRNRLETNIRALISTFRPATDATEVD